MDMQFILPEATLQKTMEVITINQIEKDIPVDFHLYDIFSTYSAILKRGLKDVNGKFTWNEVHYMLASINGTLFPNRDIDCVAICFVTGLIDFKKYDEVQARQFDINPMELVKTFRQEHPISVFALASLLHQYWVNKKVFDDAQQYIEQYLQLKEQ